MDLDQVIDDVLIHKKNIFLNGFGGCGKSFNLQLIFNRLIEQKVCVYKTAATGIAALNIGGITLHRFADIGIGKDTVIKLYSRIMAHKGSITRWRNIQILIIDEISMIGKNLFEKLDYIARKIRNEEKLPFGGIKLVISGDFLQLPPINDKYIFESSIWEELNFKIITLKEPKRYDDLEYFQLLLRVREGKHTKEDIHSLKGRVKAYQKLLKQPDSELEIKPTILYAKKLEVEEFNLKKLNELDSPIKEFVANDEFKAYTSKFNPDFYTNVLDDNIPKVIKFKIGAQVMLKINMIHDNKLVNGSRGVIIDINDVFITVKFKHTTENIERYIWENKDDDGVMYRSQFPLILSWSLTIHKIQGSTLDCAVIDLGDSIFANFQAYVALSRVRNFESLYIMNFYPPCIKVDPLVIDFMTKNNLLLVN